MFKPTIVTFVDYYLPGYKAGGPIRTISSVVDKLGDEFQFKIVTRDRDLGDTKPYPEISVNAWNKVGKAEIFYMSPDKRSLGDFRILLGCTRYDVLYFNSFFSPDFTIKPLLLRKLRLILEKPFIVAPRGEFSPGAFGLQTLKKQVYIAVAKFLKIYCNVHWQASSAHEKEDIFKRFKKNLPVVSVTPNLLLFTLALHQEEGRKDKIPEALDVIFLSRISRMKNLDGALDILAGLKEKIRFDIYGPIEDRAYWAQCLKRISLLPGNIVVKYCGCITHDQVGDTLMRYDLFFLPTLGENFGHVILEALCAGCPVLISDRTPWRGMKEKGAGWDLPLDKPEAFRDVLRECCNMTNGDYIMWSARARALGLEVTRSDEAVKKTRELFEGVVR